MASRAKKVAVSGGVLLGGALGLVGLTWLLLRGGKGEAGSKADALPPEKPPTTPTTPTTDPVTPAGPPTLVGPWCSTAPSAGPPAAIDPTVLAYVEANQDPAAIYLWLMLALYVTGWSNQLPTLERLKASVDTTGFDTETQKALNDMLRRAVGADVPKMRQILDAWWVFKGRDATKDRPCPVFVPAALNEVLAGVVTELDRTPTEGT